MKTNLKMAVFVLTIALSCAALAQGTFLVQNHFSPLGIDAPVYDAQGGRLAGNDYLAELYGGFSSNSLSPATPRAMTPFLTGISAGYFRVSYGVTIADIPGNGFGWLQVRAWDARLGPTYEEVVALGQGGYGVSPLFNAQGGDPNGVPPTSPRYLIGLQSFSLLPVVPEPSTWALLALGGTVLWAFRCPPRGRS